MAARWPAACEAITGAAEQACNKRFDLLGYRDLSFGDPVDWHLDAVSGRRAPLVPWSRLDPLDATALGDSKVTWELNRHQWLVGLGCAYRLSGDERYAAAVVGFIGEWIDAMVRIRGPAVDTEKLAPALSGAKRQKRRSRRRLNAW